MKNTLLVFMLILVVSCGKKKTVLLPEIPHSKINKIHDVSAAYLFYDTKQPDSVEFNRKNLISTTNWLVNVDKRLTLKQAIPYIQFLQDKRLNAKMHKNENARNYFSCNDTGQHNLGFIDFTKVFYHNASPTDTVKLEHSSLFSNTKSINFSKDGAIFIVNPNGHPFVKKTNKAQLVNDLKALDSVGNIITLRFYNQLLFQDYIEFKSLLENANFKHLEISNQEFIDN